jgi:hypothetical protein
MVFAMHGMGDNEADVPAMVLLPELLFRRQFDRHYMHDLPWRSALPNGTPIVTEDQDWHVAMEDRVPPLWPDAVQSLLARQQAREEAPIVDDDTDWQLASRYRPFWPDMEAFAIPSYYDGRVRINLMGRQRYGMVSPDGHHKVISEIKNLLEECVDPLTSEPVVKDFYEPCEQPLDRGPSQSDLAVFWRGVPSGLKHPKYGQVGPIPYRRTGGHSGACGFLYCAGCGLPPDDYGYRSSFTMLSILQEEVADQAISGQSIVRHVSSTTKV